MKDMFAAMMSLGNPEEIREEITKPPFGYPGAKNRGLLQLLPKLKYDDKYGEPFGGSGCVLLARNECDLEIFNDRYSGVTSFYRVLRDKKKKDELMDRVQTALHSREEFLWCRDTWEKCEDDVERAARWYYMMRMSFGAQGRNFGRSKTGKAQMGIKYARGIELFEACHQRMLNVQIENQDWRLILKDYDSTDMVWYMDPPYWKVWKGMFVHEMKDEDHEELLHRIFGLQGFVAISSYPNELYDDPKWKWDARYEWNQRTSIMSAAATETNNLAGKDPYERLPSMEVLYIKE